MPTSEPDLARLRRAIALAAKGRFRVEPNPVVGCVIDAGGKTVGEAWHDGYGGPHAEARALALAGPAARGATAYVSLEPCGRTGKKTPPCVDALLAAGVARVVYASADATPGEQGRGAERLRAAGVVVEGPVLPDEGAPLLARYERARGRDRPWVVLKWAMSLDGRIAPAAGKGGVLSGERALVEAHEARGRSDAVAVGVGTVLADDPLLTCRLAGGPPDGRPQPLRVVFDSTLRTPPGSRLVLDARNGRVLLACARAEEGRRRALEAAGAEVLEAPGPDGRVDLVAALRALRARGVARLLVEGGSRVHGALLALGLADQVTAVVSPIVLGGESVVPPAVGTGVARVEDATRLEDATWRKVGEDLVLQGYVAG
jgi:diaminohydroxyphosphoribosylaminopyrimidine deaminase/5-amino-6-(5-phosphoribosylamino)uracil reductase